MKTSFLLFTWSIGLTAINQINCNKGLNKCIDERKNGIIVYVFSQSNNDWWKSEGSYILFHDTMFPFIDNRNRIPEFLENPEFKDCFKQLRIKRRHLLDADSSQYVGHSSLMRLETSANNVVIIHSEHIYWIDSNHVAIIGAIEGDFIRMNNITEEPCSINRFSWLGDKRILCDEVVCLLHANSYARYMAANKFRIIDSIPKINSIRVFLEY
jgi:hypothetical protein